MKKIITSQEFETAYKNLEYKRLIGKAVRRYNKVLDYDERLVAGLTALQKCLESHDDSYGQKFTTSLWRFCDWECRRILKSKKNHQKNVSLFHFSELLQDEGPSEETLMVRECVSLLDEPNRKIINQYYFDNLTMEEIGKINGYSRETARKNINKSVDKLKNIIQDKAKYNE